MSEDVQLDYDYMMQQALRYLMRDVLQLVADIGDAPGEHHFYIEFLTGAPGVAIPDHLREDYPERMTIVLQHQFEDLMVSDDQFAVTLWFKGREARLEIPFDAVTSFADPSVQFGLRFEAALPDRAGPAPIDAPAPETPAAQLPDNAAEAAPKDEKAEKDAPDGKKPPAGDGADIVSLDAFRKK